MLIGKVEEMYVTHKQECIKIDTRVALSFPHTHTHTYKHTHTKTHTYIYMQVAEVERIHVTYTQNYTHRHTHTHTHIHTRICTEMCVTQKQEVTKWPSFVSALACD